MDDIVLSHKRCAFGSTCMNGKLDLMVIRGSVHDDTIQEVVEEFFDTIFEIESKLETLREEKELKDLQVVGWAGGESILKLLVNARGDSSLLESLEGELSRLAYRLARKLDLGRRFDPDRVHRFLF